MKPDLTLAFVYCPHCGAPLAEGFRFGRSRRLCRYCGFIQFNDPKVAVGALVTDGRCVLLVRRAAIPKIGFWAVPAGYMDGDELPEDALVREVEEETGLRVEALGLQAIVPLGGWDQQRGLLLLYRARPVEGPRLDREVVARDDVSEARWFEAKEIPWEELAFDSTKVFLQDWLASLSGSLTCVPQWPA